MSKGDVSNALISLSNIVCDAPKAPKIVFTPKQKMRDAANQVELSIDRSTANASSSDSGSDTDVAGTFG